MRLLQNRLYHIYNQGNNRERIFYSRENNIHFLRKLRKVVLPYCEVLAYCFMPNHFHFLIYTTKESVQEVQVGNLKATALSNGFRTLLSSYTLAINKQEGQSGSLLRQRTKTKLIEGDSSTCFHYIHQNPLRAGLVGKMEDWEFSSFADYAGKRNGSLCNQALAYQLVGVSQESLSVIDP